MDNSNGWTEERRKRQSQLIQNWKPWLKSTGAKTTEGKEASKMNAEKHGLYGREFLEIKRRFRELHERLHNF